MTLRFAADEHIPLAAVRGLVARGLDVVRFQDIGRRGLADEDQLPWATSAGRVIVTHDPDFLALAAQGIDHAGIAFCQANKYQRQPGQLITAVMRMAELDASQMSNEIRFL